MLDPATLPSNRPPRPLRRYAASPILQSMRPRPHEMMKRCCQGRVFPRDLLSHITAVPSGGEGCGAALLRTCDTFVIYFTLNYVEEPSDGLYYDVEKECTAYWCTHFVEWILIRSHLVWKSIFFRVFCSPRV